MDRQVLADGPFSHEDYKMILSKPVQFDPEQDCIDFSTYIYGGKQTKTKMNACRRIIGYILWLDDVYGERVEITFEELKKKWNFGSNMHMKLIDFLLPEIYPSKSFLNGNEFWKNIPAVRQIDHDAVLSLIRQLGHTIDDHVLFLDYYYSEVEKHSRKELETPFTPGKNPLSNRLYHPILNYSKGLRNLILSSAGYSWQYDVKSCFPVLLSQFMRRAPASMVLAHGLDTLNRLAQAPDAFREGLCERLGRPGDASVLSSVKLALSALLMRPVLPEFDDRASLLRAMAGNTCPAVVGCWKGDVELYLQFSKDTEVLQLVRDYRLVKNLITGWMVLHPNYFEDELCVNRYWVELARKSNSPVYWICEALENKVRKVLISSENDVFPIHDCVVRKTYINPILLEQMVLERTGYQIRLSVDELV